MLTLLCEDVSRRADAGDDLGAIECAVVERAPLDEDRRAALWLYAWCRTGTRRAGAGGIAAAAG